MRAWVHGAQGPYEVTLGLADFWLLDELSDSTVDGLPHFIVWARELELAGVEHLVQVLEDYYKKLGEWPDYILVQSPWASDWRNIDR